MIYLDTNAILALNKSDLGLYSKEARRLISREADLRISPIVLLELEFLREIKRIRGAAHAHFTYLEADIGLRVCDRPFEDVARQATEENWTRDPFDRMIVAQARLAKAVLITRDQTMQAHYNRARD